MKWIREAIKWHYLWLWRFIFTWDVLYYSDEIVKEISIGFYDASLETCLKEWNLRI